MMLRGARRKFSFDLAMHRSKEKNRENEPELPLRLESPATSAQRKRTYVGPTPEPASPETRQTWMELREAREKAAADDTPKTNFKPKPESARRGRLSARGDDSPRIRELSRESHRRRRSTTPKPPASKPLVPPEETPTTTITSEFARSIFGTSSPWYVAMMGGGGEKQPAIKPDPAPPPPPPQQQQQQQEQQQQQQQQQQPERPSWQQLKAKALEADYASMVDFAVGFEENSQAESRGRKAGKTIGGAFTPRAASATRNIEKKNDENNGLTFEKWFTHRFPENNLSSAPATHRALWAESERQRKTPRKMNSSATTTSYLDRLRSATPKAASGGGGGGGEPEQRDNEVATYTSGSVKTHGRVPRDGGAASTIYTVTWKIEHWSNIPSGFRQGARFRPPGGSPWSLDLYKGGIKKERPGMIAIYVHYDAPDKSSYATVTSLNLILINQTNDALHISRKHQGTRVFGPQADQKRRISTSAGTASLANIVLTQVQPLGFIVGDTVILRAEVEVAPATLSQQQSKPASAPQNTKKKK